jgi:hypothetical protein
VSGDRVFMLALSGDERDLLEILLQNEADTLDDNGAVVALADDMQGIARARVELGDPDEIAADARYHARVGILRLRLDEMGKRWSA